MRWLVLALVLVATDAMGAEVCSLEGMNDKPGWPSEWAYYVPAPVWTQLRREHILWREETFSDDDRCLSVTIETDDVSLTLDHLTTLFASHGFEEQTYGTYGRRYVGKHRGRITALEPISSNYGISLSVCVAWKGASCARRALSRLSKHVTVHRQFRGGVATRAGYQRQFGKAGIDPGLVISATLTCSTSQTATKATGTVRCDDVPAPYASYRRSRREDSWLDRYGYDLPGNRELTITRYVQPQNRDQLSELTLDLSDPKR